MAKRISIMSGLAVIIEAFRRRLPADHVSFNFDKGLMNGAPAIVGWTRASDGFAVDVHRHNDDATFGCTVAADE